MSFLLEPMGPGRRPRGATLVSPGGAHPAAGAGTVGVGPDGDAELAQPLDEGKVLGVEVPLDLSSLARARRLIERPRLAVAERDEQADALQSGRQVVGVVSGPDIAVSSRVTPERVRVLAELAQQALDQLG